MLKRRNQENNLQVCELGKLTKGGRNGSSEIVGIKGPEKNHRILTYKKEEKC